MSLPLLALCRTKGCWSFALPGHTDCRECEQRWFAFDPEATIEAACYLLRAAEGLMEFGQLMSLLYLADVQALLELEKPITGTNWYAVEAGVWSYEIEALAGMSKW